MDPVGSLIGSVLLGFGVILVYAAYRNKRVFGAEGIIPQAIATGSVTNLSDTANAADAPVQGFITGGVLGAGGGKQVGRTTQLDGALSIIKSGDPTLGQDIENRVNSVSSSTTRAELTPLAQLLAIAEGKGFRLSVEIIKAHILAVTGERI